MPILTETFEGSPAGQNLAQPAQDLEDNEARLIQDGLLSYPGMILRRGPVKQVLGSVEFSTKISGGVQTIDPSGTNRIGIITGDAANGYLAALSDAFTTSTLLPLSITLPASPPSSPYRVVSVSQCISGGALIGISDKYGSPTAQILVHWRGARKANYTTGTITYNKNSTAVTGVGTAWTSNVEPGMFLFVGTTFIGVVKTITNNTALVLEKPSLQTGAGSAYTLQSLRGVNPRVMRGRITASSTDVTNKAVTGATTKFKDQGLGTGTWDMYRASDYTYLGTVSSVTSNTALTLVATPAIDMANEAFVAIRRDGDYGQSTLGTSDPSNRKVGFITEVFAERQWYLNLGSSFENSTYLWFTETSDFEGLDLSPADGDFIRIGTTRGAPTPGRGLAAAYNGLLVYKESETYIVRGTSRTNFSLQKLADDGTLSGGSIQKHAGGVIWAGRDGIYFYDGIQVENISTAKLGDYYKNLIRNFDPSTYRMWSMLTRDHYMLFIENASPNVAIVKGVRSSTPTQITIVINLTTRAYTTYTNMNIRGAIQLPADTGEAVWYFVNGFPSTLVQNSGQTSGGAATTLAKDVQHSMKITVAADGWAPRITAYLDAQGAGASGSCLVRASLYADSAGAPGSLLSQGNEVTLVAGTGADNVDFDLMDGVRVPAGTYHIVLHVQKDNFIRAYGLTGAVGSGHTVARTYRLGASDPYGTAVAGTTYYRAWLQSALTSTIKGYICDSAELFDNEDVDAIGCDSGEPGPDFFYESKKFSAGDSLRKKLFKQLAIHYMAQGGPIRLDTVVGLNDIGKTSTSVFPSSAPTWDSLRASVATWDALFALYATWSQLVQAVFRPKRIKFLKRSTHLSFRLYQASPLMTRMRLGPFQIGYKLQRPGRI